MGALPRPPSSVRWVHVLLSVTYPFPRPAVTADVVLFTVRKGALSVLLVQRKKNPFKGAWALPGGFVNPNEPLERAALRELKEEAGVTDVRIEQLGAFGDPGRDPRGHTVTVAYVGFVMAEPLLRAGDDARQAVWHSLSRLALTSSNGRSKPQARALPLAFDHGEIVRRARHHMEELLLHFRATRLDVVPEHFTFQELQHVYEVVLSGKFVARNFRARLLELGLIEAVDGKKSARHRAERLYRWRTKRG